MVGYQVLKLLLFEADAITSLKSTAGKRRSDKVSTYLYPGLNMDLSLNKNMKSTNNEKTM